jgi:lysophospholipase L1-like esterase
MSTNTDLINSFNELILALNKVIFGDNDEDVVLNGVTKPVISKVLKTAEDAMRVAGGLVGFGSLADLNAYVPAFPQQLAEVRETGLQYYYDNAATPKVWKPTGYRPNRSTTPLTASDNLNNIISEGTYWAYTAAAPSLEKNYPSTRGGTLVVYKTFTGSSGTIASQLYLTDTGEMWYRYTNTSGSAWLVWERVVTTKLLDSTDMTKMIPDGTDLNTLTVRGQYDLSNANANTYVNMPPQMIRQFGVNGGGILEVIKSRQQYITIQRFLGFAAYGNYSRSMLSNGSWGPWTKFGNLTEEYSYKDLNLLTDNGVYACFTNPADVTNHHFPASDQFLVEVYVIGNVYRQVAYKRADNAIWTRSHWGTNGWQPWERTVLSSELDAFKSEVMSGLTLSVLSDSIKKDLCDPFKPTLIKLIGDSITWGMGGSAGGPIVPRSGQLTDIRNPIDTSISKTWANLLRTWIAKVYGNGIVTADVPGSGYTLAPIYTRWTEIYKKIKMTNKNGTVSTDSEKLSYITQTTGLSFNGSSINMVGPNFPSLRPTEMEITLYGDNVYFCCSKHAVGDSNDKIEVYLDGNLHSSFSYYDTVTDINAQFKIDFPMGQHTVKFKNVSTSANSYAVVWGFRVDKRITVANDGIIGSSTKTWIDNQMYEGSLSTGKDDLIIFMLGTNDRGTVGGQDGYIQRLGTGLTKMKTLAPNAKIVMMCSTFAANEDTVTYKANMRDINNIMREFSKTNGVKFFSHYEYCAQRLLDSEVIHSDGLHLNDLGNRLYFENTVKNVFDLRGM